MAPGELRVGIDLKGDIVSVRIKHPGVAHYLSEIEKLNGKNVSTLLSPAENHKLKAAIHEAILGRKQNAIEITFFWNGMARVIRGKIMRATLTSVVLTAALV